MDKPSEMWRMIAGNLALTQVCGNKVRQFATHTGKINMRFELNVCHVTVKTECMSNKLRDSIVAMLFFFMIKKPYVFWKRF